MAKHEEDSKENLQDILKELRDVSTQLKMTTAVLEQQVTELKTRGEVST